ncbi:MAG TPA: hypothetical protein VEZ90_03215 [Blastocatellia bacterium]|nr:hypothetical protein [Blastocatellia bacterium]
MTRPNASLRKILGSALGIVMLAALGLAFGSTAGAQPRYSNGPLAMTGSSSGAIAQDEDRDRDYQYDREDVTRIARDNGFRDGFRIGREDRENFRHYDADDNPWYRRADSGFRAEMGHFDLYRMAYRSSFLRGYSEGFRERD